MISLETQVEYPTKQRDHHGDQVWEKLTLADGLSMALQKQHNDDQLLATTKALYRLTLILVDKGILSPAESLDVIDLWGNVRLVESAAPAAGETSK